MTDTDRIASIRARADAATPGPWVQGCEYDGEWRKIGQPGYGGVITPVSAFHAVSAPSYHYADAEFIAAARTDVPFLLDQLAAAEAAIEGAPHADSFCTAGQPYGQEECVCWKAKALEVFQ